MNCKKLNWQFTVKWAVYKTAFLLLVAVLAIATLTFFSKVSNSIDVKNRNGLGDSGAVSVGESGAVGVGESGAVHSISFKELSELKVSQDDPVLISYIKNSLIEPPASEGPYYELTLPDTRDPSESHIADLIEEVFPGKRGGSFLEAGAFDGEIHSTTLFIERYLDWRGLLVEGSPLLRELVKLRRRKVPLLKTCLSPKPWPMTVMFTDSRSMRAHIQNSNNALDNDVWFLCGKAGPKKYNKTYIDEEYVKSHGCKKRKLEVVEAECVPLYSALVASELTQLDFLSLDIEGAELAVMKTIPFDQVKIKLIRIEVQVLSEEETKGVEKLMKSAGYTRVMSIGAFNATKFQFEQFYIKK